MGDSVAAGGTGHGGIACGSRRGENVGRMLCSSSMWFFFARRTMEVVNVLIPACGALEEADEQVWKVSAGEEVSHTVRRDPMY